MSASAPGFAMAYATAEAGGEPVDVVLEVGGAITGRVVDAGGSPVEEARITAEAGDRARGPGGFHSARADEGDGSFLMPDVAPGTYDLGVEASVLGEAARAGVRVAAGRTTDVGTIALARGGTLQGVVVDAEGRGIPGATVHADRDANRRTNLLQTQTGSTGAFELSGLPMGPVQVSARHPSYAASVPVVAEVDPEKEAPPSASSSRAVGASRGGRCTGTDGRSPAAACTRGRSTENVGRRVGGRSPRRGWLVRDGAHPCRKDEARSHGLHAVEPDGLRDGRRKHPDDRRLARSGCSRRGSGLRRSGAARRGGVGPGDRGGQPEAGVLVGVIEYQGGSVMAWVGPPAARSLDPSGPPPLNAVTREDGGYELLVFTPGRAFVQMRSGGQEHPGRDVEFPDAERYPLDLEIGGVTVSGLVVDRETGEPVPEAYVSLRPRKVRRRRRAAAPSAGQTGGSPSRRSPASIASPRGRTTASPRRFP